MHSTGIILAAGNGTRINPLSAIIPKPLLPVCNKPIMQYQIEAMRDVGIRDIVIVVGALDGPIARYFGTGEQLDVCITYVLDALPQGIARSLALAEPYVSDVCVVYLGDIFLLVDDLDHALGMVASEALGGVLLVKRESSPEAIQRNFAVILDNHGHVTRVLEKPTTLVNDLKGCGVYVFGQEIFDAIRHTPRSALRNEYELTDAVQTLIDAGHQVRAAENVRWDINVTFPVDLLNANMFYLRQQKMRMVLGRNTSIASGTTMRDAVIGDNVHIEYPLEIVESVIWPGVRVEEPQLPINRCLMLPQLCLNIA